jgi:hypothetical protein
LAGCIGKLQSLSPLEQETVDQPLAPSKVPASLQAVFDDKFQCLRWLPVAKMTKKIRGSNVFLPMGVLRIDTNQRYNTKMSDTQTSDMIKFAVTFSKEYTITLNTFNVLNRRSNRSSTSTMSTALITARTTPSASSLRRSKL